MTTYRRKAFSFGEINGAVSPRVLEAIERMNQQLRRGQENAGNNSAEGVFNTETCSDLDTMPELEPIDECYTGNTKAFSGGVCAGDVAGASC